MIIINYWVQQQADMNQEITKQFSHDHYSYRYVRTYSQQSTRGVIADCWVMRIGSFVLYSKNK